MPAPVLPPEKRLEVCKDAIERILTGETLEEIANSYGIKRTALNNWLLSMGDEYHRAREVLIDSQLSSALTAIEDCAVEVDSSESPYDLARTRERLNIANSRFRSWSFIAERRDSKRYGNKQELVIDQRISISSVLEQARGRTIDGEAVSGGDTPTPLTDAG